EQGHFRAFDCDVAVIVAYGLILPRTILDTPHLGCFNLHASLLPRWRGAAPIQRALMAGDTETGVMVMRMEEGLDTGPVCLTDRVDISPDTTAGVLHDVLAERGADLMVRALDNLERNSLDCVRQAEEGVTYARKIEKAEARIDWQKSAQEIHNQIRGFSPFPGAWCEIGREGALQRVKILQSELVSAGRPSGEPGTVLDDRMTIACGTGCVRLTSLQRAGKKAMTVTDFLRGWPLSAGDRLA
ncbi:MAG: methionyl-tRNA formyltransferase, partial [Fimbriimonadaceae bacterium]|nr:methionyl-tRNA formyltransferase [Alphaproteobacteria bacterium]